MLELKLFTIFGAGILASLSPCVYPLLPITVGYFGSTGKSGRKSKITLYILGQAVTLTALGWLTVKSGESLGFTSQNPYVNLVTGILLVGAGVYSLLNLNPRFTEKWNRNFSVRNLGAGLWGAFLLGASSALLASPCTTPILSGVLALMASENSVGVGLLSMLFYTLGFSLLLLALGLGLLQVKTLPRSGPWLTWLHRISGILLISAGLYYGTLPWRAELW